MIMCCVVLVVFVHCFVRWKGALPGWDLCGMGPWRQSARSRGSGRLEAPQGISPRIPDSPNSEKTYVFYIIIIYNMHINIYDVHIQICVFLY